MLAFEFHASGDAFLGALAGTYCFSVIMAFLQLLIFPGIFAPNGLLGAAPQSAAWIWVLWHSGYPLFAGLALLTRLRPESQLSRRAGVALMFGAPALGGLGACFIIIKGGALPTLVDGVSYEAMRHKPAVAVLFAINTAALAACIRITRLRDLVSLWLAIALLASLGDSELGIIAGSRYSLGWYGGRMLAMISSSVVLCALIFEFSQLYGRLESANRRLASRALRDGLTGAFNRGYFIEQFPRKMSGAVRDRTPLCLVMIDVDHFKSYNDAHGHQAGDDCLIGVVGAITGVLRRPADFVARYGGEEFAVVLPATGREGALKLVAAIQCAVRRMELPEAGRGGPVTISFGLASFDPEVDDFAPGELIRRADSALYKAKQNGRDAVFEFSAAIDEI